MYIDNYHEELDRRLYGGTKCSETIAEVYVPLPRLAEFMSAASDELKRRRANVIYGTIRLICAERRDVSELGKEGLRLRRVQSSLRAYRARHCQGRR